MKEGQIYIPQLYISLRIKRLNVSLASIVYAIDASLVFEAFLSSAEKEAATLRYADKFTRLASLRLFTLRIICSSAKAWFCLTGRVRSLRSTPHWQKFAKKSSNLSLEQYF